MSSKSQWRELIESLREQLSTDRDRPARLWRIRHAIVWRGLQPPRRSSPGGIGARPGIATRRAVSPDRPFVWGHGRAAVGARSRNMLRSLSLFEPIAFNLLPARDPDLAMVEAAWNQIEGRWIVGDAHGAARSFVDYWSGAGAFAQLREPRQAVLAAQVPKLLLELRAVADESRDVAAYRRIERADLPGGRAVEPGARAATDFNVRRSSAACELLRSRGRPHGADYSSGAGQSDLRRIHSAVDASANIARLIPEASNARWQSLSSAR